MRSLWSQGQISFFHVKKQIFKGARSPEVPLVGGHQSQISVFQAQQQIIKWGAQSPEAPLVGGTPRPNICWFRLKKKILVRWGARGPGVPLVGGHQQFWSKTIHISVFFRLKKQIFGGGCLVWSGDTKGKHLFFEAEKTDTSQTMFSCGRVESQTEVVATFQCVAAQTQIKETAAANEESFLLLQATLKPLFILSPSGRMDARRDGLSDASNGGDTMQCNGF